MKGQITIPPTEIQTATPIQCNTACAAPLPDTLLQDLAMQSHTPTILTRAPRDIHALYPSREIHKIGGAHHGGILYFIVIVREDVMKFKTQGLLRGGIEVL